MLGAGVLRDDTTKQNEPSLEQSHGCAEIPCYPSRRGQRRSHDALSAKQLSTDPTTGEVHLRHHITADGFYRGKKVIQTKTSAVEED